jgi:glycosyltransferase involved in cell wall biosynthesis
MLARRHTIVCLSSQIWDEGMWTNKQHIMSRLARHHRVIHVDYGLRTMGEYLSKRYDWSPRDFLPPWKVLTDVVAHRSGDLYTADAWRFPLARHFKEGSAVRDFSTYDFKVRMVARHLRKQGIEKPIVWVYHPGYGDAVRHIPKSLLVYDCVDNYAAFPDYRDDPGWLIEREKGLCKAADVVTATSAALFEAKRVYNPERTHLVHNVGDYEHFSAAQDPSLRPAEELTRLEGPVIGFVGAVSDYKLNTEWVQYVAEQRPAWNVVIVGPIGVADPNTDVGRFERTPNIHLLGHREYADLPRYLRGFDVAVIPYRLNAYTESVFPIKFFEFLSSGKPVVISKLPALETYWDRVRVAGDKESFLAACEAALQSPDEGREARIELAKANRWDSRVEKLMALVEAALDRR